MSKYFSLRAAVMAIMIRSGDLCDEILLQRRQNTGFADGQWDFAASGHLEAGESLTQAMQRELMEEIGVAVDPEDMAFCHLTHLHDTDVNYMNCYFKITAYHGTARIMEPNKCSALEWFPLSLLPETLIESRRRVLESFMMGSSYSEAGF